MPLPSWLARINRVATNRMAGPVAARAPGFAVVEHRGRRSGRAYRTPVGIVRDDQGYIVALTYGAQSEWVRNVLAAGECVLEHRGRRVHVTRVTLIGWHEAAPAIPPVIRSFLILMRVEQFLRLEPSGSAD